MVTFAQACDQDDKGPETPGCGSSTNSLRLQGITIYNIGHGK
jgi:hypothetical protein